MITLAGYPNADKFFLPVEEGQMVQQFQQEMEQVKQELQQAQQMSAGLQFELQKHTEAEDAAKQAKAFKDKTDGIGNLVDAAQTAQEVLVGPEALRDEAQAVGPFIQ
jgi:septal ring factor EnvC (AmiA/AmiB activator)